MSKKVYVGLRGPFPLMEMSRGLVVVVDEEEGPDGRIGVYFLPPEVRSDHFGDGDRVPLDLERDLVGARVPRAWLYDIDGPEAAARPLSRSRWTASEVIWALWIAMMGAALPVALRSAEEGRVTLAILMIVGTPGLALGLDVSWPRLSRKLIPVVLAGTAIGAGVRSHISRHKVKNLTFPLKL